MGMLGVQELHTSQVLHVEVGDFKILQSSKLFQGGRRKIFKGFFSLSS